jgi:hypothetical protein
MYTPDYGNAKLLYEERLRDAENQRKHNQLVRAATAYAQRENGQRGGLLHQIKTLLQARNQESQEVTDVRATAV